MHFTPIALALLVLVVACEPSPLPPDAEALAARYADSLASFEERCVAPQSLLGAFGREAEPTLASRALVNVTRTQVADTFLELLADDRVAVDRAVLDECLGVIDALPACPVDPTALLVRAGCYSFFVGERALDEGCGSDFDCAPGLFCDGLAAECGRCADNGGARAIEPLELCADPLCGLDAAPSVLGAACTTSCGAGPYPSLLCVDGACVARSVADIGESCDLSWASAVFYEATLVHCRDSDFGSTACRDLDEADALGPVCIDLLIGVPAPFVPGAVVSAAFVPGVPAPPLECAR